jgi:hypothetical protein
MLQLPFVLCHYFAGGRWHDSYKKVWSPESGGKQASIRHPASGIRHPASGIRHPVSHFHPASRSPFMSTRPFKRQRVTGNRLLGKPLGVVA